MKKITALLGLVGVVSLFSACSDSASAPAVEETAKISSSSGVAGSSEPAAKSSSSAGKAGNISATADTTVVHDTIRVPSDKGDYKDPYFSSGIFCWSAECDASMNSSSSAVSSSSITIEINMSSSSPTPPLVSGNQMIDQRDQKSYSIAEIAGKKWMTENINYATSSAYFCKTADSEDMCAIYGGFYTYASALKACPDGWRLPTVAEVQALDAVVEHEWWQIGGRFKISDNTATDYGLEEEQGYIWIKEEGEYTSFRVKNYGGDDNLHELQSGSVEERAYNVRCVQN